MSKHSSYNPLILATLLASVAGLVACGQSQDTAETAQEPVSQTTVVVEEEHKAIEWFEGTIEEAFAQAETDNKPLFFYWGAIWCPPCEQIKATVFKHPAFLAKTSLFIPVYLDGDTERAQSWGQHFDVAGYPTMIVFSPEGEEITRIPGWIDSEQYLNVLQLALDDLTSTLDLLKLAIHEPDAMAPDAYTRLAFYSWEQATLPEDLEMKGTLYATLAEQSRQAGNHVAWSRLLFHSLNAKGNQEDFPGLSEAEKTAALSAMETVFTNPELVLANSDYALLYFEDLVPMLTDQGASRDKLVEKWIAAMDTLRDASQLSGAEHIASWYPVVANFRMNNPEAATLPADLEQEIIAFINAVDQDTRGEARQNVINTSYQLLEEAGRADLARELLLKELEKSHAPYYFMSSLGGIEEDAGNIELAVEWNRKAWEGASGEATRFQWGYQYVDTLVRLVPEQSDVILGTSEQLLSEFSEAENMLSGRNFARLQMLLDSLGQWQETAEVEDNTAAGLEALYSNITSVCKGSTLAEESQAHCLELQTAYSLNL